MRGVLSQSRLAPGAGADAANRIASFWAEGCASCEAVPLPDGGLGVPARLRIRC